MFNKKLFVFHITDISKNFTWKIDTFEKKRYFMFKSMIGKMNLIAKTAEFIDENQVRQIIKPVLRKICEKTRAHVCEVYRIEYGIVNDHKTACLTMNTLIADIVL